MIDRKVRILLVDDDIMNGELLKKRLDKRENFDCTYVKSPLECLQIFDKQDFDIVLLDIVMPEMSGNDVLKEIRKTKNSFELPIIMVTAKDEASDVIASLKNGANDEASVTVDFSSLGYFIAYALIRQSILIKNVLEVDQRQADSYFITLLDQLKLRYEFKNEGLFSEKAKRIPSPPYITIEKFSSEQSYFTLKKLKILIISFNRSHSLSFKNCRFLK